jgi:predicted phosphodiesterase
MTKKKVYKSLNKDYPYDRGRCVKCNKLTTHKVEDIFICNNCMALEDKLSSDEKDIIKELKNSKLTPLEIKSVLKTKNVNSSSGRPYEYKGKTITFGVFGDSHIGHNCYDSRLMKYATKTFNDRKVDFVVHTGDVCEGHYESKREGSIFELTDVGGDAQVNRAVKELSKIKSPIYFITGNHETNTFFKHSGFDIGNQIQQRLPNAHYLGQGQGKIDLSNGQHIEVFHPDGGTAYAISYRPQKIAESLEGGTKPAILLIGHYHKSEYIDYRNIHIIQTGTLCGQTPFMRGKNLAAMKGFWIVEADVGKYGIASLRTQWFKAY